jgi:hypothetical protein
MDETRFDRRKLLALAGGFDLAAVEAKAARGLRLPSTTGSWELFAHDLAATGVAARSGERGSNGAPS